VADLDAFLSRWSPCLASLLRIVAALLFLLHGTHKLFGIPAGEGVAPVPLLPLMGVAGALEVVGGILLVGGLFTRPVAFILSGEIAVAHVTAHAPQGFWPVVNGGELAVLYCFQYCSARSTVLRSARPAR
jgi:putative oxidoreductase